LTAGSLAALTAGSAHPSRVTEVCVLIAANLVATVLRFVLYRHWVFGGPRRQASLEPAGHVHVHVPLNAMSTSRERTS
jgi:hypothetical protein